MLNMYKEPTTKKRTRKKGDFRIRGNQVHFISLGCPRNMVDTEVMLGILLKAGYEATPVMEEADTIVINTCGFLKASRDESLATVEESLQNKKDGARVVVTGCMVQTHSDEIKKNHPTVDYFLGSGDVEGILKAVEAEEAGEQITTARSYLEAGEVPRQIATPKHFAYLKIAEGCRKKCAYCIIPDIKGPLKSKPLERVKKEFTLLLNQGVKELILIAQDLGDWGKDIGFKKTDGLIQLLKELLKDDRKFWLRLLYLYPDEINDELIALMKGDSRICPYLDMPIQHINNDLLKSMRRATNKEQITSTITKLRKEVPGVSIRTSLIVGFPGETEQQFQELCSFVKEHPLDNVGIFMYSNEEGAHSSTLPNQISDEEKLRRQTILADIQQTIVAKRNKSLIGKTFEGIVEGYHPETELLMRARHAGQCPDIDGQIIVNDGRLVKEFGEWHQIEITDVAGYDLIGRVVR